MSESIVLNHAGDDLFYNKRLPHFLYDMKVSAKESVYGFERDDFLNMSNEEVVDSILDDCYIETVVLHEPEIHPPKENGKDFFMLQKIPFTGNIILLTHRSALQSNVTPAGCLVISEDEDTEIQVFVDIPGELLDNPIDIKTEADKVFGDNLSEIQKALQWNNSDAKEHNETLEGYVRPVIETRRRRLLNITGW